MKRLLAIALCVMMVGTADVNVWASSEVAEWPENETTETLEETEAVETTETVEETEAVETTETVEETEAVETTEAEGKTGLPVEPGAENTAVESTGISDKTVTAAAGCTAAELQDLLNENQNGEYRLTVVIPAGTYKLNRSLYVYPNTTIKAAGAKLVKQSGYGAMIEAKLTADDGGYDGNHDITIDGGTWDSTPVMNASEGTETFRFIHCNTITVKNATLCNVPEGSHLIVLAGVQNGTVSNCKFYGYGKDYSKAETPKEAIQLDTVHSIVEVPTNQADEILNWDDLPCDKITVTGCEFYKFSRGIGSHTAVAGRFHSNITIQNNQFHDLSDSAIRLYNYKDTVVKGNTIKNAIEGILAYTYMEEADENSFFQPNDGKMGTLPTDYNIQISGNTITNMKMANNTWGDGIRIIGVKDRPMRGVDISGNTITTTARYGIFATTAPDLTIYGNNKISSSKSDGILLTENSSSAKIYGNTVTGAGTSGISVYNSGSASVYSNTVSAPKEHGIYLIQSEKCVIGTDAKTGNKITNAGKSGIYLTTLPGQKTGCTSAKVQYNTVSNAGEDGIGAYTSSKVSIQNNTVSAKANGIYVNTKCTYPVIASNVIKSAGKSGIWASSGSKYAQVTGNQILKYAATQKGYGIYIYQSGGSQKKNTIVQKNTITGTGKGTGKDGIRVSEAAYTTVSGNTVTKAMGAGIYIYKSKYCTIGSGSKDYNTVKTTVSQGIYLTTSCDGGKVQYNRLSGVKGDGIGVYSSAKVTVKGNTVSAAAHGINVNTKSKSAKISDNTITSAGKSGIWLASKSNSSKISNNTIKKYGASGDFSAIYVYQSGGTSTKSRTEITGNKITGTNKRTKNPGIKLSGASNTLIQSNKISSAQGTGIYVLKSKKCTINKNTVTAPKERGIYVTTSCDGAKITSNTVTKAAGVSISTYGAAGSVISSNKITAKKSQRGIWVSQSNKSQIKSNTVTGAKKGEGIVVTGSAGCKQSKNKVK